MSGVEVGTAHAWLSNTTKVPSSPGARTPEARSQYGAPKSSPNDQRGHGLPTSLPAQTSPTSLLTQTPKCAIVPQSSQLTEETAQRWDFHAQGRTPCTGYCWKFMLMTLQQLFKARATLGVTLEMIPAFLSTEFLTVCLVAMGFENILFYFILLQGFQFLSEDLNSSDEPETSVSSLLCSLSIYCCWRGPSHILSKPHKTLWMERFLLEV